MRDQNFSELWIHEKYSKFQNSQSPLFDDWQPTVCSSKNLQSVTSVRAVSHPLSLAAFGVRESKSEQEISNLAVVFKNKNSLGKKCIFAPYFTLGRCNWVNFQAFFGRKLRKFWFCDQSSKCLKRCLNAFNWLKKTFSGL